MSRSINMLTGVRTVEVSIVPRGANNKRFALTKESTMPFADVIKNVLDTAAEGEDKIIAAMKGQDKDTILAAVAHFRLQQGFADTLDKEAFANILLATGYADPTKKEPTKKEPTKKDEPETKLPAAVQKQLDDTRDENVRLAKEVVDIKRESIRKDLVVECEKEFAHVPGLTSKDQAEVLLKARDVGPEFEKQIRDQWSATSEAIKKSVLLRSAGSPERNVVAGSASEEVQNLAKELTDKGDLSHGDAVKLVLKKNGALYERYLAENPAQTGDR